MRGAGGRRLPGLVLALALTLVGAGCSGDEPAQGGDGQTGAQALPAPLPSVELEPFGGGEPVDLADQRGPMVVNLWASWCKPCRDEMPILEEFSQDYADRVDVLGIDYQDPQEEKARELVEQTGVSYPLLTDPEGELDRRGPFPHLRGLPFLAFVDADGQVVAWEFEVLDDLAELEALVDEHLGVR